MRGGDCFASSRRRRRCSKCASSCNRDERRETGSVLGEGLSMCTFSFPITILIIGVTFNSPEFWLLRFDYSFDYPFPKLSKLDHRIEWENRVSERSNNGNVVVLSFILYRNIKFVQIIIRNNIVTIMDDNWYIYICVSIDIYQFQICTRHACGGRDARASRRFERPLSTRVEHALHA